MTSEERGSQLRRRRQALGFTRGQMAAGTGLGLRTVHMLEQGGGSDGDAEEYSSWLTKMEGWSGDVVATQLQRARNSQRFFL